MKNRTKYGLAGILFWICSILISTRQFNYVEVKTCYARGGEFIACTIVLFIHHCMAIYKGWGSMILLHISFMCFYLKTNGKGFCALIALLNPMFLLYSISNIIFIFYGPLIFFMQMNVW